MVDYQTDDQTPFWKSRRFNESCTFFDPWSLCCQYRKYLQGSQTINGLLNCTSFWNSISPVGTAFENICNSIGVCESESASISTSFSSLLHLRAQVWEAEWLVLSKHNALYACLVRQTSSVLSKLYNLAYVCHSFYLDICVQLNSVDGVEFTSFDSSCATLLCHFTLHFLSSDDKHYKRLLQDFMIFTIKENGALRTLRDWLPRSVWV